MQVRMQKENGIEATVDHLHRTIYGARRWLEGGEEGTGKGHAQGARVMMAIQCSGVVQPLWCTSRRYQCPLTAIRGDTSPPLYSPQYRPHAVVPAPP